MNTKSLRNPFGITANEAHGISDESSDLTYLDYGFLELVYDMIFTNAIRHEYCLSTEFPIALTDKEMSYCQNRLEKNAYKNVRINRIETSEDTKTFVHVEW